MVGIQRPPIADYERWGLISATSGHVYTLTDSQPTATQLIQWHTNQRQRKQGDFCPAFFNTNKGHNDHEQATHIYSTHNACESLHTTHMDSDSDRDTAEPADSDTSDRPAIKSVDILQC